MTAYRSIQGLLSCSLWILSGNFDTRSDLVRKLIFGNDEIILKLETSVEEQILFQKKTL